MKTRKRRWPSDARISIECGKDAVPALVDDVSMGGLKIRARHFTGRPGDEVTIVHGGLRATGEVLWVRGAAFGLTFRPALNPDMLGALTGGLYRALPDETTYGHGRAKRGRGSPSIGHLGTM